MSLLTFSYCYFFVSEFLGLFDTEGIKIVIISLRSGVISTKLGTSDQHDEWSLLEKISKVTGQRSRS